eukprot:jgi/Undpi1/11761/HiC_scaffold_37.g14056.m1
MARSALSLLLVAATTALSAAPTPGQERTIRNRVSAPLVYLQVQPRAVDAEDDPILELVGHPAFRRFLGAEADGSSATTSTIQLLQRFFSRSGGELEIALTGILPVPDRPLGQPLLVFRGRLTLKDAETIHGLLSDGRGVLKGRVGGHRVYALSNVSADRPGGVVEVVVAGRDLLVSNTRRALEELLEEGTTTGRPLATHDVFRRLRGHAATAPGSLSVWVDWPRVRDRVDRWLGGSALLWNHSGLRDSGGLLASVEAVKQGFRTTALLDMNGNVAGAGWVDLLSSMPSRRIADAIPVGGVASAIVSVDLERLAKGRMPARFRLLHAALTDGCMGLGLSFEHQVLRRIGDYGALQMLLVEGHDGLQNAWSLRARSRKDAAALFDDLRRAVELAKIGELQKRKGKSDRIYLKPLGPRFLRETWVSVVGDSLVATYHPDVLDSVEVEHRKGRKSKLGTDLLAAGLGRKRNVSGVFQIDLSSLLGGEIETAGFPMQHAGVLDRGDGYLELVLVSPR